MGWKEYSGLELRHHGVSKWQRRHHLQLRSRFSARWNLFGHLYYLVHSGQTPEQLFPAKLLDSCGCAILPGGNHAWLWFRKSILSPVCVPAIVQTRAALGRLISDGIAVDVYGLFLWLQPIY